MTLTPDQRYTARTYLEQQYERVDLPVFQKDRMIEEALEYMDSLVQEVRKEAMEYIDDQKRRDFEEELRKPPYL